MKITLSGVTKRFASVEALRRVDVVIEDGELFTLLGPSGCGKTTTLRLIAGFYDPDEGQIYFEDRLMNGIPTAKRNIGIVFQNFALWPHMSVFHNIAYGLKFRRMDSRSISDAVEQALHKVGLSGLGARFPGQLSGGQQQRVALARALVLNPDVLLLDEPLSSLDAKVRVRLRAEIRKLQQELGITTVYVTHDQEEALTLSDRIAVMHEGLIQQIGTPRELYERPATRFVADFIGTNNLLPGTVEVVTGLEYRVKTPIGDLIGVSAHGLPAGAACCVAVRPENMAIGRDAAAPTGNGSAAANTASGRVGFYSYMGSTLRYEIETEAGPVLKVDIKDPWHHEIIPIGTAVWMSFAKTATLLIPEGR
ncbi:MAG: ABC transporter ATP-binding protein [Firmicutes bacterium]|nr:ABC transporter ATP-binding protein [Bacillota bacterium]